MSELADAALGYAPDERLIIYGSLAPGCENEHVLAPLPGIWVEGRVHGHLLSQGWASGIGYPGFCLDPAAPEHDVLIFCSPDLPDFWDELDAFEGHDYRRVMVEVMSSAGPFWGHIYELADKAPPRKSP